MRWGIRRQNAPPSARCEEDDGGQRGSKGKGKAFSFSPLSWLAKIAAKEKQPGAGAAAKRAPAPTSTPKNDAAAAPAFPSSCIPTKRTSPSPEAVTVTPGSSSFSPPRGSTADAAVPRRRSVGNDNADSVAVRRQSRHGSRHCSVGGDRELPPLGRLIPFSLVAGGSPAQASPAAPSDTDAAGVQKRHRHRRRRSTRRISVSGDRSRRPSFSGRVPLPPRVRVVRSPRRATAELEGLAVVRRTRDPQRAFRESMVEMIASATGGGDGHVAVPPRPEELERLLACYLSLNADEHHDCIVKVFRQVWFEYVSLQQLTPRPESGGRRRPPTATARRC